MSNKYLDLFSRNHKFGVRLIVLCVLLVVIILIGKNIQQKNKRLEALIKQKQLATLTPVGNKKQEQGKDIVPVISGIFISSDVPLVFIADQAYREGDTLGEYTIYKITPQVIILEHKNTKQKKEIPLKSE